MWFISITLKSDTIQEAVQRVASSGQHTMRASRRSFSVVFATVITCAGSAGQEEGGGADYLEIPGPPAGKVEAAGFLGVSGEELTVAELEKMGLLEGVRLTEVGKDSPADKAGLVPGDIILRVDESEVGNMLQLRSAITDRRPGEILTLDLIQKKQRVRKRVTLDLRPARPLVVIPPEAIAPRIPNAPPNGIQRFQRFGLGEDGQRFKMRDNDGTVEVVGAEDIREATVWDMSNKITFEGPWVTPQDKAVPSQKTRDRIERVEKTFALRLRRPQPFVLPQRRPNPAPQVPAAPPDAENQPKQQNTEKELRK